MVVLSVISIIRFGLIGVLTVNVFKETQNPRNTNSTNNTSELTYFLKSVSVIGQMMEPFALIAGLMRINYYANRYQKSQNIIKDLKGIFTWTETWQGYERYWSNPNRILSKNCGCMVTRIIIAFVIVLNFIISIVPPILLLAWTPKLFQHKLVTIAYAYSAFTTVSFLENFAARFAMIIATFAVGNAWIPELENKSLNNLLKEYKERGHLAASIHGVFQEWFVIKWIVYFVDITVYSVIAIRSLFGSSVQKEDVTVIYVYIILQLIYNFVAFMTLYMCGGLMNSYHEKYCKKVEKRIKTGCKQSTTWKKQCALSSLRKSKYKFVPSLCGFSIPLDNSGYTLSLMLALVAFIANFVSSLT